MTSLFHLKRHTFTFSSLFLQLWLEGLWRGILDYYPWHGEGDVICHARGKNGCPLPCWTWQNRSVSWFFWNIYANLTAIDLLESLYIYQIINYPLMHISIILGVLIACFLVFKSRMSANQAILFVRAKRPNSIQTRGQLLCVREFAQFLVPLRSVFSCAEPKAHVVTLSQYLTRQRHLLHGYEARLMKNVPKIIHLVCRLLLDIAENRQTVEEEVLDIPDLTEEVEKTVSLQALQQLGKEMRVKGIPISSPRSPDQPSLLLKESQCDPPHDRPLCSDQEFDVLWRWPTVDNTYKSQLILSKCFSYSDSALHKLDSRVQVLQSPQNALGCKSGLNFTEVYVSQSRLAAQTPDFLPFTVTSKINNSPKHGSLTGSCSSLVESTKVEGQASCSPVSVKRVPLKEAKRSMSYGFLGRTSDHMFSTCQGGKCPPSPNENTTSDDVTQQLTDVPSVELPPDTRRLFVAKALTMDIDGEDLRSTVSMWQVGAILQELWTNWVSELQFHILLFYNTTSDIHFQLFLQCLLPLRQSWTPVNVLGRGCAPREILWCSPRSCGLG